MAVRFSLPAPITLGEPLTTEYNRRREALLGMSLGAARNRLNKRLMFSFAQQTGRDTCYRCGERIETVDEFSVEHKEPWQQSETPLETFFDLDNIAFSHFKCNSGAATKSNKVYASNKERKRVGFKRYYEKHGDEWNERRNERRRKK